MPSPRVRVQGTATARALPDRAELGLTVTDVKKTKEEALQVVGARSDAVTALLAGAGIPDADWRTSGVRVDEEREWRSGRSVRVGQRATASFTVSVNDLSVVNSIVSGAVADADAAVDGPDWIAGPANPARVAAYQQAALDAKVRAGAYAAALGQTLGDVVRIEEPDTARATPRPMARMAMMTAAAPEPAPEPVHVGEIEVDATVVVTFALLPSS